MKDYRSNRKNRNVFFFTVKNNSHLLSSMKRVAFVNEVSRISNHSCLPQRGKQDNFLQSTVLKSAISRLNAQKGFNRLIF